MTSLSRRQLCAATMATALSVVSRPAWAGQASDAVRYLDLVDPELRPMATAISRSMATAAGLSAATLEAARQTSRARARPILADPAWYKTTVSARGGSNPIVYVMNASPGARRPAILHMHGGGYVTGSAAASIGALQPLAAELDCTIVSVEYRLSPEATYRQSVEDNYAALRWLHGDAARIGIDPARIVVMGESAGGGHAAMLALAARDRREVPLAGQVLIYPMLDDRTASTIKPPPQVGQVIWTGAMNRFGWASLLGQDPGSANVPADVVPGRRTDLSNLPPTFIGVGALDLFADEDIAYARRLIDAAVATELLVVPGAFHSFDNVVPGSAVATRFTAAMVAALRRMMSTS